jgi:hypothetical protein
MLGTQFVYEGDLPQFIEEGRNMESIWVVQVITCCWFQISDFCGLTVENGIFPFCFVYPTTEAKYELDFNHLL